MTSAQLGNNIDIISRDTPSVHLYYDKQFVQERFKLPERKKDFKGNFISYVFESALLYYYCLRDQRFRQIAFIVFNLIKQIKAKNQDAPKLVFNAFIELKSTFIKAGQFLSSRTDLLPKEYIEALSKLQDSLPPIPFNEVKLLVENELRKPLHKIFEFFEETPIASASIGQVHKAKLLNSIEVVVKIQRPDLNNLFYQDLAILRCLATYFERYTEIGKDREWIGIIDEIGKTLFEEIDFIQEGRNADRFRKNLKYEERIYIPKIFWQFTTRKLITIEFVPGIKITDLESLKLNNIDPKELALILVNAYFKQFFEDGFYHADPHPGNLVVKNDGIIVFYDFGMVGRINEVVKNELANVLVSIIGNDTDTLLDTLKKLELIKSGADLTPIKKVIEEAAYKYYDGAKLGELDLNGIENDLKKLFNEKPIKLPSKFAYTLRATGTLEGICRTLDPDFSLVSVAKPYFQDWVDEKLPDSKWLYLKALFPNQSKLIDKVKIYVDVIKDLPQYVSNIEYKNQNTENKPVEIPNKYIEKSNYLEEEIRETNSKLNMAYTVIFLLSFVLIGNFLIERTNGFVAVVGVFLLCISLIGSIGIVCQGILKKG